MAYRKTKDVCCAVGEYTDAHGAAKKRWQNVGAMLTNDEGQSFILINRTFNPAGAPASQRGDPSQVALALFDPQDNRYGSQQPGQTPTQAAQPRTPAPARAPAPVGEDDDIPFILNLCYYEESTKLARRLGRSR